MGYDLIGRYFKGNGGKKMKKASITSKGISMLNAVAIAAAKQSANSACLFIHHQPKVPAGLATFNSNK